jgi:hypothetical protein
MVEPRTVKHIVTRCKLCGEVKSLLSKSHIIPEFMYAPLFDENHKLNVLAPAQYVKGNRQVARPSSGEYEGGILCKTCDNVTIGQYESYAHRALYGGAGDPSDLPTIEHGVTETGIPISRVTNIRYKEFKLFLLSILWRSSISSRRFFRDVKLGPYEESVRRMLVNGDPGGVDQFPVIIFSWLSDSSVPKDIVGEPGINRKEKGIRYIFPIAGLTYVYHVSPTSMIPDFRPFTLLPTNVMSVFQIPEGKTPELFNSYFRIRRTRSIP